MRAGCSGWMLEMAKVEFGEGPRLGPKDGERGMEVVARGKGKVRTVMFRPAMDEWKCTSVAPALRRESKYLFGQCLQGLLNVSSRGEWHDPSFSGSQR